MLKALTKTQFIRAMHIKHLKMSWGKGDNYCYILTDEATNKSWIIDPSFPSDVEPQLPSGLQIDAIVNTHHHWDHSGGNEHFGAKWPGVQVIAGKDSPLVSYTPADQDTLKLGENIDIKAIHTPCHTQDSICYYAKDKKTNEQVVFTGDTLFTAGCGRFFEGDAQEMDVALNEKLAALPNETKVYPGHEYTKSNVKFAKSVLDNAALSKLENFVNENEVTTGEFTIGDELQHNPFMMLSDPSIQKKVGFTDKVDVMKRLRELKNNF